MKKVVMYTDGACKNNPGPGGYACIITYENVEKVITGSERDTTNNRMELMGVISGLEALRETCDVTIITDSRYVCDSISLGWMENWKSRGWIKSDKSVVPNKDLWIKLDELLQKHYVNFNWIKGHAGHEYNERCDKLAVNEILKLLNSNEVSSNVKIYADVASTTKIRFEVIDAIENSLKNDWANPSSIHSFGISSAKKLEDNREKVAKILDCKKNEIIFTSSGTEANNLAVLGFARKNKNKGNHIICSTIEHPSVLSSCAILEKEGFSVVYVNPNADGVIEAESIEKNILGNTILVCVMHANNETGVVNPIFDIANICHKHKIAMFSDGVAALPYYDVSLSALDVDMYSISGHKIGAPAGVGILYKKENIELDPILIGGQQENGLRAGTENLHYISGMVKALELSRVDLRKTKELVENRDFLINMITSEFKNDVKINGINSTRLPGIVSMSFKNVNNDLLVSILDNKNVYVSKGTTCKNTNEYSHVLNSMGLEKDYLMGTIRVSIDNEITREEIVYLANVVVHTVKEIKT